MRPKLLCFLLALLAIVATSHADDVPYPGSISGRVVNATGEGIDGICIDADSELSTPEPVPYSWYGMGRTGADGMYRILHLAPGNYFLGFHECGFFGEYQRRYLPQYYSGKQSPSEADRVPVLVGETRDINVTMVARTGISGRVLDPSGSPAVGVCAGDVRTDSSGHYRILPESGDLTVAFGSCDGSMLYETRYYDSASTPETATVVHFTQGVETVLKDQTMIFRPAITGRVLTASGETPAGVCVSTLEQLGQTQRRTTRTDGRGFYELRVPNGDYKIRYYACNEWGASIPRYQQNYYRNAFDESSAVLVHFAGSEVRLEDTILVDRP